MAKFPAQLVPDVATLLALEPEELAGIVLEFLNSVSEGERGFLNRYNFGLPHNCAHGYPVEHHERAASVLMEGWMWLEREGMIQPKPGASGDWVVITRRGRRMKSRADLDAYRRASLLPSQLLHPTIAAKAVGEFIRGDYETAVFQAFKEVEVAVRAKGGYTAADYGTALMRKAFDANTGRLRDPTEPQGEREAAAHFFAGAIGRYKNPGSHRAVTISDPGEAVELLLTASHLLRIVDKRVPVP